MIENFSCAPLVKLSGGMSGKSSLAIDRPARKCRKVSHTTALYKKHKAKEKESQVRAILKKNQADRSSEEECIIKQNKKVVKVLEKRAQLRELNRQKSQEVQDSAEELEIKVSELAEAVKHAENLVIYIGAGISTAASIPDYRGPNGVWTLLQQGKGSSLQNSSLVDADPTLTHMALAKLVEEGMVKHIVSQNCDGLHLRSGVPPDRLSELHGNMYIEVCTECEPERQYVRLFDVTEQTSLRRHKTSRDCHKCKEPLRDTIVHFGEKGVVDKPLNWSGAMDAAEDADAILCLGSSLKVLRRYQCLWNTDRPKSQRPKLFIVNLQWTPKDSQASLKIHGRCDDVMLLLMKHLDLSIPLYTRNSDPIFKMATPLKPHEEGSYVTKSLMDVTRTLDSESSNHSVDSLIKTEQDSLRSTHASSTLSENIKSDLGLEKHEDNEDTEEEKEMEGQNIPMPSPEGSLQVEGSMPGWFGKGCRKKVVRKVGKRRRRSRVSSVELGS
nr:NAD-dependent protein deacetylase sirtuin-7-like [Lytechinus pictus]